MKTADLHVHSNFSDGTFTPSQLVNYAVEKELYAFALTDHDTTDGIAEAKEAARSLRTAGKTAPIIIPGIEFSTKHQKQDVHILGLDMDYEQPAFQAQVHTFRDARDIRNEKMIQNLQDAGIDISMDQMQKSFGDAVWTRGHFARYLQEIGVVSSMKEAFEKYVGEDCPYYVPRKHGTPMEAVSLIKQAGGVPVLAHPMQYHFSEDVLDDLISSLKDEGLIGIEVFYSTHTPQQEAYVSQLAKKHGLLPSGGSDFHGGNKQNIDLGCGQGNLKISYDIWEHLSVRRNGHE